MCNGDVAADVAPAEMTQISFSEVDEWLDAHPELCQDYFLTINDYMTVCMLQERMCNGDVEADVAPAEMTQISFSEVEEWLDAHPELCQDYFLTINDYMTVCMLQERICNGDVAADVAPAEMTQISFSEVEEWLDAHPDLCQDYFLTINDYMTGCMLQERICNGDVAADVAPAEMTQISFSEVEEWLDAHPELCQDYFLTINDYMTVCMLQERVCNGDVAADVAPAEMTQISFSEVEEWLDAHPDLCQDYFLRKTDLSVINAWLVAHGFLTINDYMTGSSRRGSSSSGNISPSFHDDPPPAHAPPTPTIVLNGRSEPHHRRTNSKRCLRHDFARNKSRSFFRTHDVNSGSEKTPISTSRRSSLKDMRKYTSLPPNSINMLSLLIESKVRLPQCAPIHSRSAKRELLRSQGERDFFLNIVRDVATDLDLKSLSHKTVDNLTVLLDADGASLFLVEGRKGGRQTLVSKVFDVHSGAARFLLPGSGPGGDNEVEVPWGVGVLGHVADTGETVNLQVACEDPRFDDEVDRITGYHTESLLCMAVRNAYDEIIAVAQVINKNPDKDGGHFTSKDEKLFETYLQFVGIALTNAQIVETSRLEYERNRNLLEVVHDLFEEQTSLEKVILKIMQRAQRLLKCERAAVLIIDETSEVVKFSKLFELSSPMDGHNTLNNPRLQVEKGSVSRYLLGLAERVAESGEVINVAECVEVEKGAVGNVRCLLAMPIRNRKYQIIGVASIINKLNGSPFDDADEQLFEAFTIFCGLGIHNTMMYSEVEKAMARQKVTIEVLSYHATASNKELEAFIEKAVPGADELNLYSLSFDDFSLNEEEMLLAAVSMFLELGLVKRFSIEKETLYRFLITVKRNYRDVPYHNWRHAFNVAQVMFAILMGCEMKGTFSDLEVLGMFVGCLCHDLDHRGTNNAFQEKAGSPLVQLYGTTNTMEHHHFNHAVMILSSENLNIFSSLSASSFSAVMKVLKHSILATDLSTYFELRPKFFSLVETRQYSWECEEHRELLRSMLMTASDVAASSKPWSVQERVARLVTAEFLSQGDKERTELNIQPQALMDRERQHELPQLQINWIRDICLPLYQSLGQMNPKLNVMMEGALENMKHWSELKDKTACQAETNNGEKERGEDANLDHAR